MSKQEQLTRIDQGCEYSVRGIGGDELAYTILLMTDLEMRVELTNSSV